MFRSEVLASHCCEESKNQELHNRQLSDDNAAFVDSCRYLQLRYLLKTQLKLKTSSIFPLQVQYNGHASPGVSDTSGLFSVIEDQFYKVYINYETSQGS